MMSLAVVTEPVRSETPSSPPIADLTRALVKADEAAYQKFFALYARRLLLYNLALTNADEEAAKELLQQTMIRVAKYIRVFETEPALWSWLTVLARSCWIDEHRKRKRYTTFLDLFRSNISEPAPIPEPAENLLADSLANLSPDERDLLEDKYIAGLSIREIAAARDTTEKSIESKLSRLREKLRSHWRTP